MLKFSLDRIGLREDDSTLRSVEFKLVVERISSAVGHLYCIICGLNNSKFTHCTVRLDKKKLNTTNGIKSTDQKNKQRLSARLQARWS